MNADPSDRTSWREQVEEHMAALGLWSRLADVPQDGLARGRLKRILLGVALLRSSNADRAVIPVDVIQAERLYLATPQAVDAQQQKQSVVANVAGAVALATRDQACDSRPLQSLRQPLVGVYPRRRHSGSQSWRAESPDLRESQKAADCVR